MVLFGEKGHDRFIDLNCVFVLCLYIKKPVVGYGDTY
jgi:hypothetical protein